MNELTQPLVTAPEGLMSTAPPDRYRCVAPDALTEAELQAWRDFQRTDIALASPYLCPEYLRIAAPLRPEVTVAVAERAGRPVGFLSFERHGRVGAPVGRAVCDVQAVVGEPGLAWDPVAFLREAGLSVFDFTNFRAAQPAFAPWHRAVDTSHVISLWEGFDAYVKARKLDASRMDPRPSSGLPHHAVQRRGQLERQVGPVEFRFHEPDPAVLRQVLGWKSEQYRRNGLPDAFAHDWLVTMLERIQATQTPGFAGVLSTLSVNGRLVAAHMGMRSATQLHYWYPAYDVGLSKYSPGLVLLIEMCRAAASQGVRTIEMGGGGEAYKVLFANGGIDVASGFVGTPSVPALIRAGRHWVEDTSARLPIGRFAAWPGRLFRRLDRIGRFR